MQLAAANSKSDYSYSTCGAKLISARSSDGSNNRERNLVVLPILRLRFTGSILNHVLGLFCNYVSMHHEKKSTCEQDIRELG